MKSKFCILLLGLLFVSCEYGIHFRIKNNSDYKLGLVVVSNGYDESRIEKIKIGEIKPSFIDFSENGPEHDGNYGVEVHYGDMLRRKRFGYYSNGIPSGVVYEITVKNDTILIEEHRE